MAWTVNEKNLKIDKKTEIEKTDLIQTGMAPIQRAAIFWKYENCEKVLNGKTELRVKGARRIRNSASRKG